MKEDSPLSLQRIEDAKAGDFEAYRMIVNQYSNALLSVAYSELGDFHERGSGCRTGSVFEVLP